MHFMCELGNRKAGTYRTAPTLNVSEDLEKVMDGNRENMTPEFKFDWCKRKCSAIIILLSFELLRLVEQYPRDDLRQNLLIAKL